MERSASNARDFATDLASFIERSPSPFHASDVVARDLVADGFVELDEAKPWSIEHLGRYVVRRDGAIIAFTVPARSALGITIVGAHTDSPGFRVKPVPQIFTSSWQQLAVEVYGGPVTSSWFDRELEIAGRVVLDSGQQMLVRTGPIARIPYLAVHLDRTLRDQTQVDMQRHTQPVLAVSDGQDASVVDILADRLNVDPAAILAWDLALVDSQPAQVFGAKNDLFASPRLDNLISVFAAFDALRSSSRSSSSDDYLNVVAAFDHEEIGSQSRSGAAGSFLPDVFTRICASLGVSDEDYLQLLARSVLVSADAGHGVHPNYPQVHDPVVRPQLGAGPMLKVNANQHYTSDAVSSAAWRRWCEAAGITSQVFVSNNAIPCGSTIGPLLTTRLGIRSVDVGVPLLSMHSARELAHIADMVSLRDVLVAVIEHPEF